MYIYIFVEWFDISQNIFFAVKYRLCSHMNDANMINDNKLEQLKGEEQVYEAQDSDIASRKQLDLQTPVSYKLVLKVGAQVN